MRFDTLDKKPKLYNVLILSAVFAVIAAVFIILGAEEHMVHLCITAIVYTTLVTVMLVRAFVLQLRYNPYSYNTIYYIGFALFLLSVVLVQSLLLVSMIRNPENNRADNVLYAFLNSAQTYMILSSPFILFYSIALFISNISLLMHERKRLVNVLGILLSLLLVGGMVLIYGVNYYATGSQTEVMLHDIFCNLLSTLYLYLECMLIGSIIANIIVVRYKPALDKDHIIILGCGLRSDGTPTPLLRGRVDRALEFYRLQKAETGRELIFVTSGGQGPTEANSESLAMKRYLMEQGIPEEQIIEEDRSADTAENMKFSKAKILEHGEIGNVAYSTTNYHVFRSGILARRAGMRAIGMGSKTKWYFWPNAAVREFIGLLSAHRLKQGIILGSMAVFYVALTLYIYR